MDQVELKQAVSMLSCQFSQLIMQAYIEVVQPELLESVVQSGLNNVRVELAIPVMLVMLAW